MGACSGQEMKMTMHMKRSILATPRENRNRRRIQYSLVNFAPFRTFNQRVESGSWMSLVLPNRILSPLHQLTSLTILGHNVTAWRVSGMPWSCIIALKAAHDLSGSSIANSKDHSSANVYPKPLYFC